MIPYIYFPDDGSIMIEWIGKRRRAYIAIERNPLESSIGHVWKNKDGALGGMWCWAPFEFLKGRV